MVSRNHPLMVNAAMAMAIIAPLGGSAPTCQGARRSRPWRRVGAGGGRHLKQLLALPFDVDVNFASV